MIDIKHRYQIPFLLRDREIIEMAELGVAKGHFSSVILKEHPNVNLTMIDRWAGDRGHTNQEKAMACDLTRFAEDRRVIVQKTFEEAASTTPDEFFDIVYVDGYAHTGQDEGATLEMWWPKVRSGGVFGGHDFHQKWRPTIDAVSAFFLEKKLFDQMKITPHDEYPSWYVLKP